MGGGQKNVHQPWPLALNDGRWATWVCSYNPAPVASYTSRRYGHVFTADIRSWITSRVRVVSRVRGYMHARGRFVYARWGSRRRRQAEAWHVKRWLRSRPEAWVGVSRTYPHAQLAAQHSPQMKPGHCRGRRTNTSKPRDACWSSPLPVFSSLSFSFFSPTAQKTPPGPAY